MTEINSFDGQYRFLSNFWPAPWVKLDGIDYHSDRSFVNTNPMSTMATPVAVPT